MENVFDNLTKYAEGTPWTVVNSRSFNEAEVKAIRSNTVVDSKYGKSVCFFMAGGGQTYIPLSKRGADAPLGSSIDVTKARLVTLHRDGDGNIVRVEI